MAVDDAGPQSAAESSRPAIGSVVPFEPFFASEYRRVVGLAAVLCARRVVAEELAQDAFVAAFRHWDRVSNYDDPAAWVRRVVLNLATSSARRRAREARAMARLPERTSHVEELVADDRELWTAVRALPARQAQCVALRYLEDLSVGEIGHVLGISEATVRVHLHSARSSLARRLGETTTEEEEHDPR